MKRIAAILALSCITASAQSVQTIELKETPALQPLNWCKHADGVTRGQIEPCGPGTTVGSSISTAQPEQKPEAPRASVESSDGNTAQNATPVQATAASDPAAHKKEVLKQGRNSLLKLLGFGLIFGIVAKLIGRSFLRWFFSGIALHIVLVSMNVLSF